MKRDLPQHTAMAFLQGFPMLNCGDEIAQRNGWDYKNDPDREDSQPAPQQIQLGKRKTAHPEGHAAERPVAGHGRTAQDAGRRVLQPGCVGDHMGQPQPRCAGAGARRGEETLAGLFNFVGSTRQASLDALGGEYHTPEGTSVWLADVELEPYQALLVKNK